jgi:Major Facilitator Superfamily
MSDADGTLERPDRRVVVTALGITQILAWGSTLYLLGVLGHPIAVDTGWSYEAIIGGVSLGLLIASIISPRIGRAIGTRGGKLILSGSALVLAVGLLSLGISQSIAWYLASWLLIGVGMGSGLTDAAFSTLGNIYGESARSAITSLTLFAGFASTICWPLSAYFVEHLGWRGTCFAYAAIQIGIAFPMLLLALPNRSLVGSSHEHIGTLERASLAAGELPLFAVLATVVTFSASILSMLGVHLLPVLQARGLELSAAVGLGAIVGPSQVAARVVEMLGGRYYHPVWTMVASTILVAAGIGMLLSDFPSYSAAIALYGAGNGIGSVARGTLPLALFGPSRYPALMGRLAQPILMSMAVSPFVGAIAFQLGGPNLLLGLVTIIGVINVLLVSLLWTLSGRWPTHSGPI